MSSLPELVRALLDPAAYPEPPPEVELVQTQMSFIFLSGEYVYKVKKPVNLGYLDYTTLAKRRFYCQREVELNRRLCPEAYLGVLPVVRDGESFSLGGENEPVEYAVKMRYLPREAMMDVLLTRGKLSLPMLTGVAKKLAEFHRKAATGAAISAFGGLDTIVQNTEENFAQTEKYIGITISRRKYERIKGYNDSFIERNKSLFQRRVEDGRIRDCHGDLHAAHVCFCNGICIYDCIEFNDRFRYSDVASEIAFLAMDLDHYGRADLPRHFVDAYVDESRDRELVRLLDFYRCYRAYVRGKVEGFKMNDPHISPDEKAKILTVARSYFELAESYTEGD